MLAVINQYAYFFSLLLFILPVSVAFDSGTRFSVAKKMATGRGVAFILASILVWSVYDLFWIRHLGSFPSDRILASVVGIPLEEMLLFGLALYNIGAIFAWGKQRFP